MSYRKIFLSVNQESGALINPADGSSGSIPSLYYGESAILCISFLDSSLRTYPLASSDTFEFAADNDFVHGADPLMIYSGNDMVDIPGDWDAIDRASGKISVRVNCLTNGFETKLGSAETVSFNIELKRYIAGSSSPSIMLISKAKGKNVVHLTENEPVPSDVNYYNAAQTDALLRAGRELQFSFDSVSWHDEQVSTDAYWRERYPDGDWSVAIALPAGAQGEQGEKGDKGDDGDQGLSDFGLCRGRLTLSTGISVPTADITVASTLYYTTHNGNQISLWNGTAWQVISFTEASVSLSSCAASTNYDVFGYLSSGALSLELTSWSSNTARATSLMLQNGIYVKNGDATRRYLGTIRTTATAGQAEDSVTKRFIWNYYNQVDAQIFKDDATSHTYAAGIWRYWNSSASNKIEFVCGFPQICTANVFAQLAGAGTYCQVGLAINSDSSVLPIVSNNASYYLIAGGSFVFNSASGYNYIGIFEYGGASAQFSFYKYTQNIKR